MITLDWLSRFHANVSGHDNILFVIDRFSKWAIIVPTTKSINAEMFQDVLWSRVLLGWFARKDC
jgi:hypothetical protein